MAVARQTRATESRIPNRRSSVSSDYRGKLWIDPHRIPSGVRLKWVRRSTLGLPDEANVSENLEFGWSPVDPKAYPDLVPRTLPGMESTDGLIQRGGLLLMQRSEEECVIDDVELRETNEQVIAAVDRDRQGDGVNFRPERELTSRIDRNQRFD